MNGREPIDYSAMFAVLDTLMAADLPQMKLYCEISWLARSKSEKGAADAAAEFLCGIYPDVSGVSPRNLRQMREFYRTYESSPEVLAQAMAIGWTQNVVILKEEPVKLVTEILGASQRETGEAGLTLRKRI